MENGTTTADFWNIDSHRRRRVIVNQSTCTYSVVKSQRGDAAYDSVFIGLCSKLYSVGFPVSVDPESLEEGRNV